MQAFADCSSQHLMVIQHQNLPKAASVKINHCCRPAGQLFIETKIVKWAPAGHQKPNKWAPVDNENTKGKLIPMPLSSFSHRIAIMRDDSYYELGHISEAMKEELMEPEFKQFCREKDEQLLKVVNAEFRNLVAFQFARQNFNKFKISGTHDMREHSNNDMCQLQFA